MNYAAIIPTSGYQTRAKSVDGLVVAASSGQLNFISLSKLLMSVTQNIYNFTKQFLQIRVFLQVNLDRRVSFMFVEVINVLNEIASVIDIHELKSVADTQDRHLFAKFFENLKLGLQN